MANETTIGELSINLKIKLEALEKGLETAKKKLQEIEKSNEQVNNSNKGLEAGYLALSATAVASLFKIKQSLDDGVAAYTKYKNSMMTVNKVAENTGTTLSEVQGIIAEANEFKLMDESDLNASIKNLLLYGYTAEQATDILKRLQDSAVGNRQECYSLSEAVRVTTEGIRMENSVTSDAAGVQKNIAKMYEEYAEKLGKKTDSLTQAEKAQAVYNGIMEETEPIMGSAAQIASQYEGAEAQKNAELLKTKQLIGESLIPAYTQLSTIQKNVLAGINEMIKSNKAGTTGIISFTTALTAGAVVLGVGTKAIQLFKESTILAKIANDGLTASILANPLFFGAAAITVGISAIIAALNYFQAKQQEIIDSANEKTSALEKEMEALKSFQENMQYTEVERDAINQAANEAEEIIAVYEEKKKAIEEIEGQIQELKNKGEWNRSYNDNVELEKLENTLKKLKDSMNEFEKENFSAGQTIDTYRKKVEVLNKTLEVSDAKQDYLRLTNQKSNRETLINIAQTKADIQGKQELLNILKEGKTATDEYADAKNQLVKVYPELAKVNENTIESTQAAIDAENKTADAEWANAQVAIQASILEVQAMSTNREQIQNIAIATKQSVEEVTASLQNQLMILSNLAKLTPTDFKSSVTTTYKPKTTKSSSFSYTNKALDNYKKEIDYKKSLDQLSLQQEIAMYQTALKKYAKTTDEKRELTTKIYELQKDLQQEELDNYTSSIEYKKSLDRISAQEEIDMYQYAYNNLAKTTEQKQELEIKLYELRKQLAEENAAQLKEQAEKEREILNKKIEDYNNYIQEQKNLRGAEYDVKDQEADLDKIIEIHRNYLNQILKDERYSLEERESIYREELDLIRSYEQQKRDARVTSVNDTVSQLKSAITKQIEEMEEADEKAINRNIELVEEWKNTRINAINEEYNTRIKAIQAELDALDKAEEQKTRDEEDSEYNKKKLRLEQLIAYEHDTTTKANYEKELAKLVAEYQKTLDKRALEDKKEALKEQQDLLKEEQSIKTDAIEAEAEKQKEQYETQLDDLKEYYDKQKEMAQETAEKMLLNVEQNQQQILDLLNKYGDAYEITGQSLGEKLAQGINNGVSDKIQNIIQKIQDTIDVGIENKIKQWTSAIYQHEAGANKPQTTTKTINVYQTNNIEQNPEMPSETYRKLRNIDEELAASLAGA